MATLIQQYTNHIAFVVDRSGSMSHLTRKVVEVFDVQIEYLRRRSQELNQETRVSVYLFDSVFECVVFDMDVMRLISLKDLYNVKGQTALMDATGQVITDLQKLPELHSDHAFLLYAITDGEENNSRRLNAQKLNAIITGLPDNWTVACLVPDIRGRHEAKKFGFPDGNIEIWDTTTQGLESAGRSITRATETYLTNRSLGIRGSRTLFKLDAVTLKTTDVQSALDQLGTSDYKVFNVHQQDEIRPFVEAITRREYIKGSAYYRLDKTETIQGSKLLAIRNKRTSKVYAGSNARRLLGLPAHDIRVSPGNHGEWEIFVQSTSVNRKLLRGTEVMVITA